MELDKSVSFPINKRFSNLDNPTDIFVDYTKSISIPATAHNNKVLGNAYRLDKQYGAGDVTLGLDMNPLKRIPVKLLYNGEIFFDGYAKYVSSTQTNGVVYYNINLFGALGDVFQSLMSVVLDVNKLSDEQRAEPDGGAKYILNDGMADTPVIDRTVVKNCWNYADEPLSSLNHYTDVIGFAPAYRGFYDDFESNSIVGLGWRTTMDGPIPTEPEAIEDALKKKWKRNIMNYDDTITEEAAQARVDAIDIKALIGDGVNEHAIRQFRSYEQKPYIHFCKLMNMYQKKCKELTGYDLNLDSQWFNANNPYWTRLCYMFDYLSGRGVNEDLTTPFSGYNSGVYTSQLSRTVAYSNFSNEVLQSGKISLEPFDILLENKRAAETGGMTADPLWSGRNDIEDSVVMLNDTSYATIDITFSNSHSDSRVYKYYAAKNKNSVTAPSGYSEFISVNSSTEIDKTAKILTGYSIIKIPAISIPSFNTEGLKMTVKVSLYGETDKILLYRHRVPIKGSTRYYYFSPTSQNEDFKVILPNTNFYSNWRLNTTVALKNLYTKEEPLFNVILQYTKMFGLVWKPDYINKTITITTKQSYFSDYEIVDWDDKFDGTKECVIESVSFATKYVDFNYKDTDGYRYTDYRGKYGINYGGKHIKTQYEFNNDKINLIENIHPSSISTKTFIPFQTLVNWNTYDKLEQIKSPVSFIDCEDEDQKSAIQMNNWYFRGPNIDVSDYNFYLSDASPAEKEDGKYYWYYNVCAESMNIAERITTLPTFSVVYNTSDEYTQGGRTVGCMMNCPNEDFTDDKSVSSAINNYIYDICWRDYINERYNSNNKKLTAYFKLSYGDYKQFNFNKLVKFNNQLFVVNNIFDFDPNARESTKVELIQVSDINNYTNVSKLFPIISADKQVWRARNGTGNMTLYIKAYPRPTSYEIIQDEGNSGVLNIDELTSEMIGNTVGYFLYYYDSTNYKGKFRLIGPDYTYEIPIEIN
jgi:hypothetical protein